MRISTIEAFPIRIPEGQPQYRWPASLQGIESAAFQTALVRVTTSEGITGWGEAQASVAPEVVCSVVNHLLRFVLQDQEFEGTPEEIETLWHRMYSALRVGGYNGGFLLDAIAGLDIALWDLAGKIASRPVSALLSEWPRASVPAYWAGMPGDANAAWEQGFRQFKIYHTGDDEALFREFDDLRSRLGDNAEVAVDALWRLDWMSGPDFGEQMDRRRALWLESPLLPEFPMAHGLLASRIETPIAIGQSYRTCWELDPFFQAGAMRYVQPDIGRTGITEGMRIARLASSYCMGVVPRVGPVLGPGLAAAIHFAAAAPDCQLLPYRESLLEMGRQYLREPLSLQGSAYDVPLGPGLGVEIKEAELGLARVSGA